MRGFRSTLILLAVLLGLLGYIYFYEMKRPRPNQEPPKQKVFSRRGRQDRGTRGEGVRRRPHGAAEVGHDVVHRGAAADEGRRDRGHRASPRTSRRWRSSGSWTRRRPTWRSSAWRRRRPRWRSEVAGEKDQQRLLLGDKTATGGELYAKLPSEKRVFLVSAFLETTFNRAHVRPARQDGAGVRARQGGRGPGVAGRCRGAGLREEGHAVAAHEPAGGAGRPDRRRRPDRPPADAADEVDRGRPTSRRRTSAKYGLDKPALHGHGRGGQREGDAGGRQGRRVGRALRARSRQAVGRRDGRSRRWPTT